MTSLPQPTDVLAHREPLLLVDRCVELNAESAVCERTFAADEVFFAGHFPGRPIVPGVLLVEALAQTLAYWALCCEPGRDVLLTGIDRCRFRRKVVPGELVRLAVTVERQLMGTVHATGRAEVGGELAASAKLIAHVGG